ncbi:MAG: amidohydrolase family protein, partial [Eubacteriales bacterium]|nr:amidohydrolase family protein [Eubacteriales bacterium]
RVLCTESGDKGFDVHIDALGEAAVSEAVEAIGATRAAGYKKNAFTLAHEPVSVPEDLTDTCYQLGIAESTVTLGAAKDDWRCIENAKTVEEAVEKLTVNAALQLGISSDYGSIEKGKHADFVIFDENPLEAASLAAFKNRKAAMTVIDGVIVYDAKEHDRSQWDSMLTMQQY